MAGVILSNAPSDFDLYCKHKLMMRFKFLLSLCALMWAGLGAAFAAEPAESASRPQVVISEYMLNAGDVLEMRVYLEDDLLTRTPVATDGTVSLPLLGRVPVGGKTLEEATKTVHDLLEKDYLVNPQVNLIITEYATKSFSILGHVSKPGTYDLPIGRPFDLLDAVSMAGGFNRLASPKKITVQRIKDGKQQVFKVDAEAQMEDFSAPRFIIEPNDTINVGERLF